MLYRLLKMRKGGGRREGRRREGWGLLDDVINSECVCAIVCVEYGCMCMCTWVSVQHTLVSSG